MSTATVMHPSPPSVQPPLVPASAHRAGRALAALALMAALTASAQPLLSLEVWTGNGIAPDFGAAPDILTKYTTTTPDTAFAFWNHDNVTTSASLAADYGTLRFETLMSANPGSSPMTPVGHTEGKFRDQITITAPTPDLDGEVGYLDFSLRLDGGLGVITSAQQPHAYLRVKALRLNSSGGLDDIGGGSTFNTQKVYSTGVLGPTISVHETLDYHMPFRFGQAFNLQVEIFAQSNLAFSSSAHSGIAQVNFGGSGQGVVWNGIQDVIYDGASVAGYTIISGSGTDWTVSAVTPVPEPATWAAIAGALALGVGMMRKLGRRSRR